MPELPEVESLKCSLEQLIVGKTVLRVLVRRPDIIHGSSGSVNLLGGGLITKLVRHGKQLAVFCIAKARSDTTQQEVFSGGNHEQACICFHLGMTGSIRYRSKNYNRNLSDPHTHVVWTFTDRSRIEFSDPRRFGGVWSFKNIDHLIRCRWSHLAEDALSIRPKQLHRHLMRTGRSLKSALLDQRVVAGLGNIYVDELLFLCRTNPRIRANRLALEQTQILVRKMRRLLFRAIKVGGSTFQNYVDANGQTGRFQKTHRVYGRGGQPCWNCRMPLSTTKISGRITVWCSGCQSSGGCR